MGFSVMMGSSEEGIVPLIAETLLFGGNEFLSAIKDKDVLLWTCQWDLHRSP